MNREEAIQKAERALNDPIAKGGGVALLELDHLRVLLDALRGPTPDPITGLVPWREEARKQFVEVVNENVGKRVQGCWYCNDDVMQVVDSPNKPPINATYCGLCGRKLEVEG